eukprot:CAMPEP_0117438802 /NCGR_PEP_ID=MMETSP0759-20121206/2242_1 /TAXON_ID=63605 /ORGANISM="Percolomonas cosmopolitus, Strain WS" /LENGTH=153 /DNA_ID=CAMNT_0005230507 /DNA_START=108 /DNA_END=569 /DNA_ORIENTATION=+
MTATEANTRNSTHASDSQPLQPSHQLRKWRKARIVISFGLINKVGLLADAKELYCIALVKSDDEEQKKRQIWKQTATSLGLNEDKILFCETQRGIVAIARQLNIQLCLFTPHEKEASEILRKLPASAQPPTIGIIRKEENFESVFMKCTGAKL